MAEPRDSSSATRRRDHYTSQRSSISRPSTSNTQNRPSYQGYRQPDSFRNLDETAVPAPIFHRDDDGYYTRQSPLEENTRDGRVDHAERQAQIGGRTPSRHERNVSYPRRRSTLDEPYELTEIAAPPPVQNDTPGDKPSSSTERQQYLEDEQREAEEVQSEDNGPYRPRTPAEYMAPREETKSTPKWLTELYTVSYLIFFAIWGTIARLGVQWLTFYPGTPIVTPVIWANFAGSLIMGFLAEDQALFRISPTSQLSNGNSNSVNGGSASPQQQQHHLTSFPKRLAGTPTFPSEDKATHTKRKKTIPFYIGLATGFCGSLTSFSSFARDAFLGLSNDLPTPINHPISDPSPSAALIQSVVSRNRGYSFQAWLHVVIATLALSLGGLMVGAQIAIFLSHWTPRIHGPFVQRFVDPAFVLLGWGCWLGALLMSIFPPNRTWRGEVLFALVLAPPGCLARFYLSRHLNALVPSFPLGTFAANMLGTAILGMSFDLQHVGIGLMGRVGGGVAGCQVLQGVMDGFCGCLTTISTWVAEIQGLRRRHGWVYAGGSVLGSLGLMVVIMGSVKWSVGWTTPVCGTGYPGKVHG